MGSSETKMNEVVDKESYMLSQLQTLPGEQILQQADKIKA